MVKEGIEEANRTRLFSPNTKSWWETEVKSWIKRASRKYIKAKAAEAKKEEQYLTQCMDEAKAKVSLGKEERCLYFQHKPGLELLYQRKLDRLKLEGKIFSQIESESGGLANLIQARKNRMDKMSELLIDGQPTSDPLKIKKKILLFRGSIQTRTTSATIEEKHPRFSGKGSTTRG